MEVNHNPPEADVITTVLCKGGGVEVNCNTPKVDVITNNLKVERFYVRVEGMREGGWPPSSIIVSCNRLIFSFKVMLLYYKMGRVCLIEQVAKEDAYFSE